MLAGQTQARLGGPSQVQLNPRLLPNNLNAPKLLVGARQPIQRVGNFSPSKNVPLASARGTMPNRPQQLSPARRQSSFLTYPGQLSQQRIAGQAIGLGRVPPTPVPGPTIHWPTARHSFLGSVVTGNSMGIGLSGDPDYLTKGIDLLLHRETGSVYCPVCETTYPTGALQQHILKHRQLEQVVEQQHIAELTASHRQSTILTQAGLSDQPLYTPVIVEPEEFVVQDESVAVDNFFIVDNTVVPSNEPLPPQLGRQNMERTPLQYPIERVNFYSCCDGVANRDQNSSFGDAWSRNEWIAHPRMLTQWESQNFRRN